MRREIPSVAAMAALLVGSQIAAIALSPIFAGAGFQAFQRPEDVTNTVIYLIMILAFTAVILGLVRYKRQNLAKYVIMASIFITLAFILLLPLFYALDYATGGTADGVLLGNVATVLAFTLAAGLVYLLVKFPEWYVDLLLHAPRDPSPHRPGLLRRLGRLPDKAHDHPRGRTDEPATADPPGDSEEGRLFVSPTKEPQGAGRLRRGT